jgi:ABC-type polysaccharide/polyol phosphate transport system ATPase subunit
VLERLCSEALWLCDGRVALRGGPAAVIRAYRASSR